MIFRLGSELRWLLNANAEVDLVILRAQLLICGSSFLVLRYFPNHSGRSSWYVSIHSCCIPITMRAVWKRVAA